MKRADEPEICSNPFFKCESKATSKIEVDIMYNNERHPICRDCWAKIAESDIDWSQPEHLKPNLPKKPPQNNVGEKLKKIHKF